MSGVQVITVTEDEDDRRLDRWIRQHFPNVTQGRIEKLLRKGEIRVDGGRAKAAQRIHAGQSIRIPPLPDAPHSPEPSEPTVSDADARMLRDCIVYRDDHLIVLNKPPGLAVQGGTGQTRHLDGMLPALAFDGETPKLVHRLDRDTSGLIVLARTGRAARGLARGFHARSTAKTYWAAVAGRPEPTQGSIRYGLVKANMGGKSEKMICVHPDAVSTTDGAKHALTDYSMIAAAARRTAWVALSPRTGRTHQLRAHMAEIGNPIVGDGKYGTNAQTNLGDGWGAQLGGDVSRKLHLHSRRLSLTHPVSGKTLTLQAPLPEHMARTWALFGWEESEAPEDPFEELR